MSDELRPLWDFGDLDASESRFTERLDAEEDDGMRAELLTQLARVDGLRGDFEQGEERLREAETLASSSPRAGIRIDLERGRLLNSSGSPEAALPLFVRATEAAEERGELFIAADSAHMAAIAASNARGAARAGHGAASRSRSPGTAAATGSGRCSTTSAGTSTRRASTRPRSRRSSRRSRIDWKIRTTARRSPSGATASRRRNRRSDGTRRRRSSSSSRSPGREAEGAPDGWYHEALAESAAALGRADEAQHNAELALSLLPEADPSFAEDDERVGRLRELAGAG